MRYKRSLTIAIVAATAFLVLALGSASASTLCKANEATCGSPYPPGTVLEGASVGKIKLLWEGTESRCASNLAISVSETSKPGEPLTGSIKSFTFSACEGSCSSVSANSLPWEAKLSATSGGDGSAEIKSSGASVTEHCTLRGLPVECKYSLAGATMGFEGGSPALLTLNSKVHRVGFSVCPEQTEILSTYSLSPSGVWLTGP